MAAILGKGGYPVEIELESREDEAGLAPVAAAALAELRAALSAFRRATRTRPRRRSRRRSPRAASSSRTPSPIRRTSSTR